MNGDLPVNIDDIDDAFPGPPNAGAYEKQEQRSGPPLTYVAEKFRHSLEGLHRAIRTMRVALKGDTARADQTVFQARYAFYSAVVGYLALHNMLALASEHDISERLLRYSEDDFADWLNRIDTEGSVTG